MVREKPGSGRAVAGKERVDVGERTLPHNLEAEQSVLGAMLVDVQATAGTLQFLEPEDFYSPRHGQLFEVFRSIYDRHSTLDEVMATEEMERLGLSDSLGGLETLEGLIERMPSVANAEYYARIVRDRAILRSLVARCTEITQSVYDSDRSSREKLDAAEQLILEIGEKEVGRDFVDIGALVDGYFEKIDRNSPDDESIYSGFTDLDSLTTGFHPAEFIIIAGRPSMGKTSFVMNIVEHAALAGKHVAVFSLEVAKEQLVQNMLCAFCQVNAHKVRRKGADKNDWKALIAGAARMRELRISIDDTPGLTPLSLKAKARRLHAREPIDMIVIDYLQLMEGTGLKESRQQEIPTVSRSLKSLARELDIPVLTLSQLSRGVENRESHRPRLSDLRESGAIEQDADVVLLLYREEYYRPDKEEARGKAEIIIAKQRNGPTDKVDLAFRSNILRFENLSRYSEYDVVD